MPSYKGIEFLRRKLATKWPKVNKRYQYYEMKNRVEDFNAVIPAEWKWLNEVLGWSAKAADSIADRLVFREFENDLFKMNDIFNMNSSDVLFDSAVLSAVITSCCFIYISADEDGFPRLQVIDGGNATGIIDPITMMLTEGYAVLERDPERLQPTLEAYFIAGQTTYYENGRETYSIPNSAIYPLMVPIIYRPDARRPFGHSRISRACMSIQQAALRTLKRAEISAEFYSFPQKYMTGISDDAEGLDRMKATISAFLVLGKDDEGDHPVLGQFSQQSMTPHVDQLRMFASLFAGETGLTLDDLGFATENPSSAEAIKAAHENLRLAARKAQRTFGVGFINVGYLAASLRDDFPYLRKEIYKTRVKWEPIFEPDAAMMSGIGDAALKVNQAVEGYFNAGNLHDLIGIEGGN